MITFDQTPAIIRDLPRKEILARGLGLRWWGEFATPYTVVVDGLGAITIPAGFLTDGASVPRCAWALLSDTDPDILLPSYLHDYLYASHGLFALETSVLFREDCDNLLHAGMLSIGAPAYKANAVLLAVSAFGWKAWSHQPSAKIISSYGRPGATGSFYIPTRETEQGQERAQSDRLPGALAAVDYDKEAE
jgi:hypothetical protein